MKFSYDTFESLLLSTLQLSLNPCDQNTSTGMDSGSPELWICELAGCQVGLGGEPCSHFWAVLSLSLSLAVRLMCTNWDTAQTLCNWMGERWVGREWTLSIKVPFVLLTLLQTWFPGAGSAVWAPALQLRCPAADPSGFDCGQYIKICLIPGLCLFKKAVICLFFNLIHINWCRTAVPLCSQAEQRCWGSAMPLSCLEINQHW